MSVKHLPREKCQVLSWECSMLKRERERRGNSMHPYYLRRRFTAPLYFPICSTLVVISTHYWGPGDRQETFPGSRHPPNSCSPNVRTPQAQGWPRIWNASHHRHGLWYPHCTRYFPCIPFTWHAFLRQISQHVKQRRILRADKELLSELLVEPSRRMPCSPCLPPLCQPGTGAWVGFSITGVFPISSTIPPSNPALGCTPAPQFHRDCSQTFASPAPLQWPLLLPLGVVLDRFSLMGWSCWSASCWSLMNMLAHILAALTNTGKFMSLPKASTR